MSENGSMSVALAVGRTIVIFSLVGTVSPECRGTMNGYACPTFCVVVVLLLLVEYQPSTKPMLYW